MPTAILLSWKVAPTPVPRLKKRRARQKMIVQNTSLHGTCGFRLIRNGLEVFFGLMSRMPREVKQAVLSVAGVFVCLGWTMLAVVAYRQGWEAVLFLLIFLEICQRFNRAGG